MFLAGIAFSALTVFAATISISTNFEDGAIQYLKKLVILMDNNNTWITLDWDTLTWKNIYGDNINWNTITGSSIYGEKGMFEKYCNYGWTGCVSYEELTQWWWESLWSTWTASKIYYNDGYVGIWTNNPAYKFTVNWTGYFENWLYVNWVIWPEDNWDDLKFLADWYSFKNWLGENKLVINSQGYVWIGTWTPQSMLHVNWTIQAGDNLKTYTSLYWIIESNNQLRFNTSWNNTRMTIDNSGNVGIGTSSPTEEFQVGGYAQIGSNESSSTGWNFLRIKSTHINDSIWLSGTHQILGYTRNPNIQLNRNSVWIHPTTYSNRKIENDKTLRFKFATGNYDYDTKLSLSSTGLMTLDGTGKFLNNLLVSGYSFTSRIYTPIIMSPTASPISFEDSSVNNIEYLTAAVINARDLVRTPMIISPNSSPISFEDSSLADIGNLTTNTLYVWWELHAPMIISDTSEITFNDNDLIDISDLAANIIYANEVHVNGAVNTEILVGTCTLIVQDGIIVDTTCPDA